MKTTFSRKVLFVDSEQIADNINMLLQKNKVPKVAATTNAGGYAFKEKATSRKY